VQVGRMVQDLRISRNLRQEDVAARAGVSRETVSRLERGLADGLSVCALRAISRALGMPSIVSLGWRSPELDRLRDRLHASMVEQVATVLRTLGWELAPEHSFNQYGERGSADIVAWRGSSEALLVVETKTRLFDLQGTLATLDRKRRVVPDSVARELGWKARLLGMVLVMPEMSTHRHVIERHAATFGAALPHRQLEVRHWLARPVGDLRGIWFLPISRQDDIGQRSRRKRAPKRHPQPRIGANSSPRRPNPGPRGPFET